MENQIYAEVFRPCFISEEDFEDGYKKSIFWTEEKFMSKYKEHKAALSHIAECAKIYILKNWEGVDDWTDLDVKITHGPTGKSTHYYKCEDYDVPTPDATDGEGSLISNIFEEIRAKRKKNEKIVNSVSKIVLDPTDGDFSITVNGGEEHWWIQDEAIIIIADYIENKLS